MLLDRFYSLANWNPQFFREVKGRLTRRNLVMTAIASLAAQALVMAYFWLALPSRHFVHPHAVQRNYYCNYTFTGEKIYSGFDSGFECLYDSAGNAIVNWPLWWLSIFQVFSWMLPFTLLISGVYLLISDLGKEERRGTLNFIRLSPQPSQSILLGKLLGVPVLPFLAVVLAIPLHLLAAHGAGVSAAIVWTVYLLTVAVAGCYFTGSLLFAFLGGSQGWIGAVAVCSSFSLFYLFTQLLMAYDHYRYLLPPQYLGIPVGNHLGLSLAFWLITLGVATFWLWQAVNRRFRNPNATLLSKQQSYLLTACFEFWLLGFVIRDRSSWDVPVYDLGSVALINLLWFVLLIAALTPQRQTLLDWARYRRERVSQRRQFWSRSVVKDLVWGEKSPSLLAIALNLLVATALFTPWILTWKSSEKFPDQTIQAFATILLGSMVILICGAIAQLILLSKTQRRTLWAVGTIAAFISGPAVLLVVFGSTPTEFPFLWLFSMFAFFAFEHVTAMEILVSFLAHLTVFGLLTTHLTRQLRKAGESESKALLAGAK